MSKTDPIRPMAKLFDWLETKEGRIPLGDLLKPSKLPEVGSNANETVQAGLLRDPAPEAQKVGERSDATSDSARRERYRDDLAILLRKTCKARLDAGLDLSTKAVIFSLHEHDHAPAILRAKPEAPRLDEKGSIDGRAYWNTKPAVVYWFNTKRDATQATTFKAVGSRIGRIKRASQR
jgi:hypothetical protein